MKKIILSVLVLSVLIMMVGVVSAYTIESSGRGTYDFQYVIYDGEQAIHMVADLISGPTNEATLIVKFDSPTTLGDLDSISWTQDVIQGYIGHVDVKLDLDDDGDYDGDDDALVFEYAKVKAPYDNAPYPLGVQNTFGTKGIVDDDARAWLSSGAPGNISNPAFIDGLLSEWKAGTADDPTIDEDTPIYSLEFEVDGWIAESEIYFNNLVINGEEVHELFVSFNLPEEDGYASNEIIIDWNNPGSINGLFLQYKEGDCSGGTGWDNNLNEQFNGGETSHNWDTTSLDEGEYCLRLEASGYVYATSGVFTIDRTAPTIEFIDAPYFSQVDVEVMIEANVEDENEIEEWELDFGDGSDLEEGSLGTISEAHAYEEEDIYTVTLTAKDKAGNEASATTIVVVNGEEPDWIIPLFTGRNLFSIPLMPVSINIGDVLPEDVSDNAEKIWAYQEGKWKYNTPTASAWSTTSGRLKKIVPGYGYFLFMNEDAVAYGDGRELGAELPTEEIELTPGWNLIGHRGLDDKDVDEALSSIDLGDNYRWDSVFTLNEARDGYEEVSKYPASPSEKMFATKGYWVSVITNDGPIYL